MIALPPLYVITARESERPDDLLGALEAAFRGGLRMLQLRARDLDDDAYSTLFARVREIAPSGALLLVNRRAHLVEELGARGVHLGGDVGTIDRARAVLPADSLIGYSAHRLDELAALGAAGIDYASFSPVFAPLSKHSSLAAVGVEGFRLAAEEGSVPLYGLGGITSSRVAALRSAGAVGVAAIGAVLDAADPEAAVRNALGMEPGGSNGRALNWSTKRRDRGLELSWT